MQQRLTLDSTLHYIIKDVNFPFSLIILQIQCVDLCCNKHVRVNHKIMGVYMEVQPFIIQKRIEEMEKLNQQTPPPEPEPAIPAPAPTASVDSSLLSSSDSYAIPSFDSSNLPNIDSSLPSVAVSSVPSE